MNLDDYKLSKRVKALVYGPPKCGKTALVGKLAEQYQLHWIDLEQGIKTLLNPAMLDPKFRKNVNVVNVPDHRLLPVGIDTVRSILKGGEQKVCYAHGKVNCAVCKTKPEAKWSSINLTTFTDTDILVIDSLSQLTSSAMNRVIFKEISKPNGEEYKPTYNDYAMQGALLDEVLSRIQVLDLNIVCITHDVDTEKAESPDERIVPLAGTRNFSKTVAKYFDEVIYVKVLNKKHSAFSSTTSFNTVLTGGRSGVKLDGLKDEQISLLPLFNKG